jgi:molybdate transport system substrate-binding protein
MLRLILALAILFATPVSAQPRQPLTVFAAASLTEALGEVGRAYTRATGQPVRFSFEASGAAARQIAAGARADVFVSADTRWMDDLGKRGLVQARRDLLGNRLALIAPAASRVRLTIAPGFPLQRALGGGRLAIGEPRSVPAGTYARQALTRLGVWRGLALAPAQDVRAALSYVARGEAPLGVVYASDAAAEARVRVVALFPAGSHERIIYPAAVLRGARPGAAAFYRFLSGREARAIFARRKFQTL